MENRNGKITDKLKDMIKKITSKEGTKDKFESAKTFLFCSGIAAIPLLISALLKFIFPNVEFFGKMTNILLIAWIIFSVLLLLPIDEGNK